MLLPNFVDVRGIVIEVEAVIAGVDQFREEVGDRIEGEAAVCRACGLCIRFGLWEELAAGLRGQRP